MSLKDCFYEMVSELDRLHMESFRWNFEDGLPDMITASNGQERYFSVIAKKSLRQVARHFHEDRLDDSLKIELDNYIRFVKQQVADMHADGRLSVSNLSDNYRALRKELKDNVEENIAKSDIPRTHYFPAWTLRMENDTPFSIGPVMIMSREYWISKIEFSGWLKDVYPKRRGKNDDWKEKLRDAQRDPKETAALDGLAKEVYDGLGNCPSVIGVTVAGYELEFSRKAARLIAKTAIDSLSLVLGLERCFIQQALHDEHLPPFDYCYFVETEGELWTSGKIRGERGLLHGADEVKEALKNGGDVLLSIGYILSGLVDPVSHSHPQLTNRWATALDWFAEGSRDASDAIALAKLGTCLDVLSCGGKYSGIRDMVARLTGIERRDSVVTGHRPRTLEQLVKDIYDYGRSRILHGNYYDRLKPFEDERRYAFTLGRLVLLRSALKLKYYVGPDDEEAFRTM